MNIISAVQMNHITQRRYNKHRYQYFSYIFYNSIDVKHETRMLNTELAYLWIYFLEARSSENRIY